jgi:hypothetical protein
MFMFPRNVGQIASHVNPRGKGGYICRCGLGIKVVGIRIKCLFALLTIFDAYIKIVLNPILIKKNGEKAYIVLNRRKEND